MHMGDFPTKGSLMIPADLRYTEHHTWVRREGGKVRFGVTKNAADDMKEVVFVELPKAGETYSQDQPFGVIESTKAVYDLHAPVSGKVTAVNEAVVDRPELVNEDPYGEGWMVEMEMADPAELDGLLSSEEYAKKVEAG